VEFSQPMNLHIKEQLQMTAQMEYMSNKTVSKQMFSKAYQIGFYKVVMVHKLSYKMENKLSSDFI
jgi:hypothetical protein